MKRKTLYIMIVVLFLVIAFKNSTHVDAYSFDNYETDVEIPEDYDYSFALVGDTQRINELKPQTYEGLYDWIIANKDEHKIAHVFGLGDITESWKTVQQTDKEWAQAKEYISKMDGIIPYSLVRGNHDESVKFNKTFNYPEYTSQFDGFMNENELANSYKTMKIGNTNYLMITLNYGASDDELDWAGSIINAHPTHRVIISTHAYMNKVGGRLGINTDINVYPADRSDIDYAPYRKYNDGDQLWEKFFSKYGNIVLVLCGHIGAESVVMTQSEGYHGNTVTQLLVNPQSMDDIDIKTLSSDGTGMVCMLYVNEDENKIDVRYFSTAKNKYYNPLSQYSISLANHDFNAHDFEYFHDNTHHWQECACEAYTDIEKHSWQLNDEGNKVCICGMVYQEDHPEPQQNNILLYVGIGAGFIALIGIGIFITKKFFL